MSDEDNIYKDFGEGFFDDVVEEVVDDSAYDEAFKEFEANRNRNRNKSNAGNVLNYEKMTRMEFKDYLEGDDDE